MFGCAIGRQPMPFYTTSMTIILMGLERCILYVIMFSCFTLILSTCGGSMRFLFSGNLNYLYHEYHGIRNSSMTKTTTTSSSTTMGLG